MGTVGVRTNDFSRVKHIVGQLLLTAFAGILGSHAAPLNAT
jgi:hypothetical protein